jgi:alpha-L-rhamnosidase
MLRQGATTCYEAWGKEQKWNTSLCHPWASAPVSVIIEELGGMKLTPEADEGFVFRPHIPQEIRDFYLQVPLRGKIYEIKNNNIRRRRI